MMMARRLRGVFAPPLVMAPRPRRAWGPRAGFSLFELAVGMAILALVAGAVSPIAVRYVRQEAGQKTAREMLGMLEAGRAFYVASNRWPTGLAELQGAGHLPPGSLQSPFTTAYGATTTGAQFQVSVSVPADVAPAVVRLLPFAATSVVGGATVVSAAATVPGAGPDTVMLLHRQGTLIGSTMQGPLEIEEQSGAPANIRSRGASATNLFEGDVGVGTSGPNPVNRRLHVVGPAARFERENDGFVLELQRSDAAGAGNALGSVEFHGRNSAGDPHLYFSMGGYSDDVSTGAEKGSLRFYTRTAGAPLSERLRITGDGYLGVGTTTPDTAPLAITQQGSPTPNAGGGGSLQMGVASMPVGGDRNSWLQVYNGALMLQPIGNVVGIGYPLDTYLPSSGPKLAVNGTITGTAKNFAIAHPTRAGYTLVHSVLEGPESAVYYRGQAQLQDGVVEVQLPPYFEALTRKEQRTVQLTPIGGPANLYVSGEIEEGRVVVRGLGGNRRQRFYWEVKAVRADLAPLVVEVRNRHQSGAAR